MANRFFVISISNSFGVLSIRRSMENSMNIIEWMPTNEDATRATQTLILHIWCVKQLKLLNLPIVAIFEENKTSNKFYRQVFFESTDIVNASFFHLFETNVSYAHRYICWLVFAVGHLPIIFSSQSCSLHQRAVAVRVSVYGWRFPVQPPRNSMCRPMCRHNYSIFAWLTKQSKQ